MGVGLWKRNLVCPYQRCCKHQRHEHDKHVAHEIGQYRSMKARASSAVSSPDVTKIFEDPDQDGSDEPPPTDVRSWRSHPRSQYVVAEYSALLRNVSAFEKSHII